MLGNVKIRRKLWPVKGHVFPVWIGLHAGSTEILVDDLSSSDIPHDSEFLPVDFTVPLVEGKVVFTFMLGLKICLRTMQQKARDKSKNRFVVLVAKYTDQNN